MPLGNRFQAEPMYTPQEDVTATLEDGRQIQVAVKGTPIPMSQAQALGLVKQPKQAAGPSEKKEDVVKPAPKSTAAPEKADGKTEPK